MFFVRVYLPSTAWFEIRHRKLTEKDWVNAVQGLGVTRRRTRQVGVHYHEGHSWQRIYQAVV